MIGSSSGEAPAPTALDLPPSAPAPAAAFLSTSCLRLWMSLRMASRCLAAAAFTSAAAVPLRDFTTEMGAAGGTKTWCWSSGAAIVTGLGYSLGFPLTPAAFFEATADTGAGGGGGSSAPDPRAIAPTIEDGGGGDEGRLCSNCCRCACHYKQTNERNSEPTDENTKIRFPSSLGR